MPAAPEYRFTVTEGTPARSIIATITGKDGDATGRQLHHAIVSGDPNGHFIINPSTGSFSSFIDQLEVQGLSPTRCSMRPHRLYRFCG